MNKLRESFEAWWIENGAYPNVIFGEKDGAWQAWQAAERSIVARATKVAAEYDMEVLRLQSDIDPLTSVNTALEVQREAIAKAIEKLKP